MASRTLAAGIIFLSQTVVGILGNFSLLYHYLFLYYTDHKLKLIDLILMHLIIANSLVIVSKGIPQTMTVFGLKHLFNDFGCKLLLYVQRVGRSVSINTTCLLSVFQVIMITPMNSSWKYLKVKAPEYTGYSISFCWFMHMVVNFIFPMYVLVKWNSKNTTNKRDFGYCSSAGNDKITDTLYTVLLVFPEVLFSVLIIWSSVSMIIILYKHKQQVQHIHSINVMSRPSPESRATKSILVLLSTFVSFYTISSIFNACIALLYNPNWWLVDATAFISVCFPTLSPFLLMSRDSPAFRFFSLGKECKSSNIIINM
ncbi:vomeronasal 1 receptor oryCunV1R1599 [Oryctolagus cuniculus]|uniref:Vomeronasal type-1 receptor n=1 Tax=Oryctolagus cuniculus TaxID=9986 RepID=G1SET7_RABIT|nr:vomeronasal 1 receptor oryCunV1R1599 [Oryctolagus cuniculus]